MPRALFLSPEAPYPSIGGGPLRSASLLEYFSRRAEVDAIIFRQPGDPDPAARFPPGKVRSVQSLELPFHSKSPMARALRNAGRVLGNRPPLIDRFSGFGEQVASAIAGQSYDLGLIEHFWCAPYVRQLRQHCRRVLLDLHNVESVWHARQAAFEPPLRALALRRFAAACENQERRLLPLFDALLATSQADAAIARKLAGTVPVTVYPNALPETARPVKHETQSLIFSGNLEYQPNITAVKFFRDAVWPLLRRRFPALRWQIAGKNPHGIEALVGSDPRIELTGPMPDAIAALANAQVAIAPILSGSGTRVKVIEAWAAVTAVVSTTLGAEGLECEPGRHLLIADAPPAFADAVALLLESPERRTKIAEEGRQLYETKYTWPAAWKRLPSSIF